MRLLAAALLIALGACAGEIPPSSVPAATAEAQFAPAEINVVRDGADWIATFRLPRSAQVWAFIRSATIEGTDRSWRKASWSVETPGVRLLRLGRYDALVAEDGDVPHEVQVRFTPFTEALAADYVPALVFSDGAVALFDDHFAIFSARSTDAVAGLPADLNGLPIEDGGTRVTFRDRAGPLFHGGRRQDKVTVQNGSSYVLFGGRDPIESAGMTALIEPQLPAWLAQALRDMVPAILDRYTKRLGAAPGGKPLLLASWAGPTPDRASMNGGVVPGTVLMRFDGERVVEENPAMRDLARWFVAHEGAHFWLGQAVRYETAHDTWIMEGGADLLAVRAVEAVDTAYDATAFLNKAVADCAKLSEGRGIAYASERGEHRAFYACGTVFSLVAEAACGVPFESFVRNLIAANRADGVLTRAEWLAALDEASGNPRLSHRIAQLLDEGAADPKAAIAELFEQAGIAFTLDEGRMPILP